MFVQQLSTGIEIKISREGEENDCIPAVWSYALQKPQSVVERV